MIVSPAKPRNECEEKEKRGEDIFAPAHPHDRLGVEGVQKKDETAENTDQMSMINVYAVSAGFLPAFKKERCKPRHQQPIESMEDETREVIHKGTDAADLVVDLIREERERDIELGIVCGKDIFERRWRNFPNGGVLIHEHSIVPAHEFAPEDCPAVDEGREHEEYGNNNED